MNRLDTVIIVWDKEGKYFQNWVGKNSKSPSIQHGINIAKLIKGTYKII